MTDPSFAKPQISVLRQAQIERIHDLSLQVLEKVGVHLDSEQYLHLLEKKLGKGQIQGEKVHLSPDIVEWAIEVAPTTIEIFNRKGDSAFNLGHDRIRFGAGVTTLFYMEAATDEINPFQRQHMREATRLGDVLTSFDVLSTLGVLHDFPPHLADLYGTLEMFANTTKPLVILVSEANAFPSVLDMLEELHGDLHSKPFILPYFNPITPLLINQSTADKMLVAIERQLPFIFSSYGMLGATTPITIVDTLILLNAEMLTGLTLTQLIRKGAPIILGPLPAYFDMKTMLSYYDPLSMLLNMAFTELMAYYRIPHCGTSGSTTGWGPDIVSASEMMMNQVTSLIGKVGLAPFASCLFDSKVLSPVNMVHADGIIAKARRFSEGFSTQTDESALQELFQVGPGGSFLTTERTLALFRTTIQKSDIFPRWDLEKWQELGEPNYVDLMKEHTLNLLTTLDTPGDYEDLVQRGEEFIQNYSKTLTL